MKFNKEITQISNLKTQNQAKELKANLRNRCYLFSITIINFLEKLPQKQVFRIISDQLLRSATSIGANIIEAKSSSSRRDFLRFYEIALKSANETKYWLGLLRDATKIEKGQINNLLKETEEIARMLSASILTIKGKR